MMPIASGGEGGGAVVGLVRRMIPQGLMVADIVQHCWLSA